MDQIIVTKPDNTTVKLGTTQPITVIKKAEQSMSLMGDDTVDIEIECNELINIGVGDYINAFNRRYTLFELPEITRINSQSLRYNLKFKGGVHQMQKVLYKLTGNLGTAMSADFSLTANLDGFITMLIANMVAVFQGKWVKGTIPVTEDKTLIFSNETCLSVMSRLIDEFSLEYFIRSLSGVYTVEFAEKVGRDLPDTFAYGAGRGCISIARKYIGEETFTTKLYAFGSTNNLASDYRNYSTRLKLPLVVTGDVEPPTAPQNLHVVSNGNFTSHLYWEASTDNVGVAGYYIYRSDDGEDFYLLDTTTETTYDDYGIPMNVDVRYKVKAFDAARNKSRASDTVTLNIGIPLNPPTLLYISELERGLELFWQEPTTSYQSTQIYRKRNGDDYALLATVDYPFTSYQDIMATDVPGRSYSYKARTYNAGFNSAYSNILTHTFD